MADEQTTQETPAAPPPNHLHFRDSDFIASTGDERGLTAEQMFGKDADDVTDEKIAGVFGDADGIVMRTAEGDGSITEKTGLDVKKAAKAAARKAVTPKEEEKPVEGEQEAQQGEEQEQAAAEEGEAGEEPKEAVGEKAGDEDEKEAAEEAEKKPSKHRQRKDQRYRQMEAAKLAAEARAKAAEDQLAALQQAQQPEDEFADMPKAGDFDDDDKHHEAVKAWAKERLERRDAAQAERARLAQTAAQQQTQAGRREALAQEFKAVAAGRFTPEQTAMLNQRAQAVQSKFGGAPGSMPMSNFAMERRKEMEDAAALGENAKPTAEVMADLYEDPDTLQAFENLTSNGHVLAALGALDDPVPVIRYLASEEGKASAEDLHRLAAVRPEAVAVRAAALAGRALQAPKNGGEPAQAEPETTRAPRPGNSPRAAAMPAAKPHKPPASGLDPLFQRLYEEAAGG